MSTTYPGNPAATEAPSVPPTPGVVPSVVIPADGEALNVASITQALKVLADFEAWLMSPRAKASAWAGSIQLWRNAALQRIFGVDHMGFPAGRLNHWRECFRDAQSHDTTIGVSGVTQDNFPEGWTAVVNRASTGGGIGRVAYIDPQAGWPASRRCQIDTSDDNGSYSYLLRKPPARFAADVGFAMEWDAVINDLTDREVTMGFNEPLVVTGGGAVAQFRSAGPTTNYFAETYAAVTPLSTDTGVPMDTNTRRFRIEWHAASVDDAASAHTLYFIDGVLVADHASPLPSAAASPLARPWFIQRNLAGGAGPRTLWITPVTFSSNLWLDAF